ncbi:MAG: repressor LexA, partial [Candidatus Omnitrophica bacterium]|nr:repressor LexA [Candidatus Omnitrophota bacterium]
MKRELTERQQRVVQAIRAWITEHGYPPTIRELGKLLGIKSLRGVTTHLDALAKKGRLTRQRSARGIRLLQESGSYTTAHYVPIVGRIAAGAPLLADERLEGQLLIDASLLGQREAERPPQHFALRVRGASMQEAGILDGDYVIVRQQPSAENGEIVVALLG